MNYLATLKKLLLDFKSYIGSSKINFIITVGLFSTLVAGIEPFFAAKGISYIELYIQKGIINLQYLYIFCIVWIGYIFINSAIRYYYRYYLIDINALRYYVEKSKYYKDKILYTTQGVYLEKKMRKFL